MDAVLGLHVVRRRPGHLREEDRRRLGHVQAVGARAHGQQGHAARRVRLEPLNALVALRAGHRAVDADRRRPLDLLEAGLELVEHLAVVREDDDLLLVAVVLEEVLLDPLDARLGSEGRGAAEELHHLVDRLLVRGEDLVLVPQGLELRLEAARLVRGARRRARAVARGRRVRRLDAVHLRVRSDGPRGEGREAHVSEVVLVPVGPDLPGGRVHRAELSRAARARARADGGVEGLDAAHVPAVPLLRPGPALQRHPRVHRGVRVDDRLRQFSLLPEDGQLRGRARVPDAVPAQLLRRRRVRRPAQRIHAVLHRAHAHALHALRLARAPDRQGPQRRRAGPRREGRLDPIAHGAALRRRGGL